MLKKKKGRDLSRPKPSLTLKSNHMKMKNILAAAVRVVLAEAIVEAALLRRTLREVRGNQLEAARRLGINRNTLRKRLGQLDIDPNQL